MYRAETDAIAVCVEPFYLQQQSQPEENHFVWAYRVTIENGSQHTFQLMARYWRIVDGGGRLEEVRGPGVVGEQPTLQPGDSYQYTSGCPLSTPSGTMEGSYDIVYDDGRQATIAIPAFSLDMPGGARTVN